MAGWEGLELNADNVHELRPAFLRAGIDAENIRFFAKDDPRIVPGAALTRSEIESLRLEQARELANLAHNVRGRLYKKTQWRDRKNRAAESDDADGD